LKAYFDRAAFYLTCGSLVSILFSIAVSQIFLGLALAALLFSSERLRLPPIKLPLVLFMAGTVLSLLFSGHMSQGTPQIRKFLIFAILLLVYSTFRTVGEIRAIVLAWAGVATLSAVRSLFQFWQKYQESQELHEHFYDFYVGERITGFMSHWMTFGGEEMLVLLMLAAYLFFSNEQRWKTVGWLCAIVLAVSMVLGFTRSIFLLGFPIGLLFLFWFWHRWLVPLAPLAAALGFLVAPTALKERVTSITQPHGEMDSNEHRYITRRTGIEMIRAHPLLGLGPEQVKYQFDRWVPPDIPRPLPEGWYGHLHNIYLQYAAERGIPTMLFIMWMVGKILWDFLQGIRKTPPGVEARFVLLGGVAAILAILAEGLLEYNLGDSEVLTLFLAVVGFGYIARENVKIEV
jgi:putative inorganic carbon (HCO3(-)) transporter